MNKLTIIAVNSAKQLRKEMESLVSNTMANVSSDAAMLEGSRFAFRHRFTPCYPDFLAMYFSPVIMHNRKQFQ
ncbi:Protein-Cysteine N-Palmitoyltransferase Hhat [Manis pentadactyla]|nr:Protein-Cysteine N-Palmitoyltransferase Hhat [Manis pentadactyla]